MLTEVRFQYRHAGCWILETSERYPSLTLVLTSPYQVGRLIHVNLAVHSLKRNELDAALRDWSHDKRIKNVLKLGSGPEGATFHVSYSSLRSIHPLILRSAPVYEGPVEFAGGREYEHIIGGTPQVEALLQDLRRKGRVDIRSIRRFLELPPRTEARGPGIIAKLTDRQLGAVTAAQLSGYYSWPRRTTLSSLARQLDLATPSLLRHLRRAEAHILQDVVESLRRTEPARFEAVRAALSAEQRPPRKIRPAPTR